MSNREQPHVVYEVDHDRRIVRLVMPPGLATMLLEQAEIHYLQAAAIRREWEMKGYTVTY